MATHVSTYLAESKNFDKSKHMARGILVENGKGTGMTLQSLWE